MLSIERLKSALKNGDDSDLPKEAKTEVLVSDLLEVLWLLAEYQKSLKSK